MPIDNNKNINNIIPFDKERFSRKKTQSNRAVKNKYVTTNEFVSSNAANAVKSQASTMISLDNSKKLMMQANELYSQAELKQYEAKALYEKGAFVYTKAYKETKSMLEYLLGIYQNLLSKSDTEEKSAEDEFIRHIFLPEDDSNQGLKVEEFHDDGTPSRSAELVGTTLYMDIYQKQFKYPTRIVADMATDEDMNVYPDIIKVCEGYQEDEDGSVKIAQRYDYDDNEVISVVKNESITDDRVAYSKAYTYKDAYIKSMLENYKQDNGVESYHKGFIFNEGELAQVAIDAKKDNGSMEYLLGINYFEGEPVGIEKHSGKISYTVSPNGNFVRTR